MHIYIWGCFFSWFCSLVCRGGEYVYTAIYEYIFIYIYIRLYIYTNVCLYLWLSGYTYSHYDKNIKYSESMVCWGGEYMFLCMNV
jgi:hypothetical protein